MKINHIKRSSLITENWAGGTTTQLAIYPLDGDYKTRKFRWRLSSAVVELEKSVFTKLPDVNRVLMVLEGRLELTHKDQYERILNPFNQDSFPGEWETTSVGKVRDFNLMMQGNMDGKLVHQSIRGPFEVPLWNSTLKTTEDHQYMSKGFYCSEGTGIIILDSQCYNIESGDLILVKEGIHKQVQSQVGVSGNMEVVLIDLSY